MKNTDNNLLTLCGKYFSLGLDKINGKDFRINQKKLDRFLTLYERCSALAKLKEGKIENVVTKRRNLPAQITLRFVDDLIIGDTKEEKELFLKVYSMSDAINVGSTGLEDGSFLISFFVENFYEPIVK